MENLLNQLPNPIQILLDPLSLTVLASYVGLILWEVFFPARKLPYVKYWKVKGLVSFFSFFFIASYLPMFTDPFLSKFQLFDISQLGIVPSVIIGIIAYEFGMFAYHYSMHRFNFLWRTFHQMHHSAERLDTYGALWHNPLDMIGFTLLGSIIFALTVGLSAQAITVVIFILNFLSFFQHANIKTPHWIGYIIQRPESHSIHHGRGIHKSNYTDLPIIDIIFGTFKNPKSYSIETGFYDGSSSRITDMLLFKDISVVRKKAS